MSTRPAYVFMKKDWSPTKKHHLHKRAIRCSNTKFIMKDYNSTLISELSLSGITEWLTQLPTNGEILASPEVSEGVYW